MVNALREDVRRWHESGWENASETTKRLLRHWWREDRVRRLFFCQLEAAETVIYLREILALGKKPRWTPKLTLGDFNALCEGKNPRPEEWIAKVAQHPKLIDIPNEAGSKPIPAMPVKWQRAVARQSLMAMLISWAFCNRGTKPGDPRYPRRRSDCLSKSNYQRTIERSKARRSQQLLRIFRHRPFFDASRVG